MSAKKGSLLRFILPVVPIAISLPSACAVKYNSVSPLYDSISETASITSVLSVEFAAGEQPDILNKDISIAIDTNNNFFIFSPSLI